jgi:hypothetical protein
MVTKTKHPSASHSKKSKKNSFQSYDNMMGSPMAVNKHPVSNIPSPDGGAFQGLGLPMSGEPDPSAYGA